MLRILSPTSLKLFRCPDPFLPARIFSRAIFIVGLPLPRTVSQAHRSLSCGKAPRLRSDSFPSRNPKLSPGHVSLPSPRASAFGSARLIIDNGRKRYRFTFRTACCIMHGPCIFYVSDIDFIGKSLFLNYFSLSSKWLSSVLALRELIRRNSPNFSLFFRSSSRSIPRDV